MVDADAIFKEWQESPLEFIHDMWGLTPQPIDEDYFDAAQDAIDRGAWDEFKVEWFLEFEKGKHLTWQQWVILLAVERGIRGLAPKRVTVSAGHGIGKDATAAWLILWYLFCFHNAKVPCTAPSSDQMYDVLWSELALWMRRMPQEAQDRYDWSTQYVRMVESPETWYARAKTARKESPEALAGIHAEHVLMLVDEASGVAEEIYKTAEGALTNDDIFVFLISNWTRLFGYFNDSQTKFRHLWQALRFDSRDSPIVDHQFVEGIIAKHGEDSDEFRIRVTGEGPRADSVDDEGYVPLLNPDDITEVPDVGKFRKNWARLGIDPAGEGKNETVFVIRDRFRAKIVAVEKVSDPMSIAKKATSLMDMYGIPDWQVTVDAFGVGIGVVQELSLAGYRVYAINTGDTCSEADEHARFVNMRAMISWKAREWIKKAELVRNVRWKQCAMIRYRRQLSGKLKVMDKLEMRKRGIPSPDAWDALTLTFARPDNYEVREMDSLDDESVNAAVGLYDHNRRA